MRTYRKPEIDEITILPQERIAGCTDDDAIGGIPSQLPPGVDLEDGPLTS